MTGTICLSFRRGVTGVSSFIGAAIRPVPLCPWIAIVWLACGPPADSAARAAEASAPPGARGAEPRIELLRREGVAQYNERRYFQAILAFEEALRLLGPEQGSEFRDLIARTRSALGVELFNAGEIRQASESFREALRSAEDSYAHFGLGWIHAVKLEDKPALEHLEAALRLEPTSAKPHKVLAVIEYRQGRTPQALTLMEKAVGLDPADKEARAIHERWKTEQGFTGSFVESRKDPFLLRADPLIPAAKAAAIGRRIVVLARQVGESFQLEALPSTVVVLFSPERFYGATKSFHWVGGYYDGQIKIPVPVGAVPTAEEERETDAALRHELAHVAVRSVCPECPNWLNEGMAQHFEAPGRWPVVVADLRARASQRVRFEDVPSRLWEVDDEELARMTYLQGLGLVEFLIERHQLFRLRLLLDAIHREGSLKAAFELVYGQPLVEMEAEWWKAVDAWKPSADSMGPRGAEVPGNGEPR